jgi:hypothetical protein
MGAAELHDDSSLTDESRTDSLAVAPEAVEVRRNGGLAAAVGAVASAVAIAWLARAVQSGAPADWALAVGIGALGCLWLASFLDARTPLLVADVHGVRLRLGRTWRGLPWSAVHHVEHLPRRGVLRDGRLVVVAHNPEKVLAELDRGGARQARLAERMYGAPFAVPLGLTTRVLGSDGDVPAALERVAMRATEVVVVDPTADSTADTVVEQGEPGTTDEPAAYDGPDGTPYDAIEAGEQEDDPEAPGRRVPDPRPFLAAGIARLSSLSRGRADDEESEEDSPEDVDAETDEVADGDTDENVDGDDVSVAAAEHDAGDAPDAVVASATPSPLREPAGARRSEVRRELPDPVEEEPVGRELRRPGTFSLVEETQSWGDRVRPIARQGDAVEPLVIDEFATEPAEDPVVGPEVAAARTRLGLTVDQLAERTRIRPHVIEAIEVDDFAPCGGDFYARGHLRTLARVLGVDAAPLLESYDERYARAPINPRHVFEAELATGVNGSIRGTRGGPNWSVLVALVMALVLAWSIARLATDSSPELPGSTPVLNGSGGPGGSAAPLAEPVDVVLSAPDGGAHVVVRDGAGEIVFKGNLAVGDTRELQASPPLRVQSTDGAVTVGVDGRPARAVGEPGEPGQGTFVAR